VIIALMSHKNGEKRKYISLGIISKTKLDRENGINQLGYAEPPRFVTSA
jgi:hypothetical protein